MIIQSQFSEFSYGYAMTEHYVRALWPRVTFAPRFPTLRRERMLGYDVRISGFGYFQFKRANGHDGPGIKERPRRFGFAKDSTIYRMTLSATGKRNQHDKLLRLEQLVGNRANVYYACPGFARMTQFNKAYRRQQVPNRSMLVRPSAIGPLSDEPHHVSFNRDSVSRKFAWCFSDPVRVELPAEESISQELARLAEQRPMSTDELVEHVNRIQELYLEYGYEAADLPEGFDRVSPSFRAVLKLTLMLRTGFDIEPLILGDDLWFWHPDFLL